MTKSEAQDYCESYGLHLPVIMDEIDVARMSPFVNINMDFWLDGSDSSTEGVWQSEVFDKPLHGMPWAVAGNSRSQDCIKYR